MSRNSEVVANPAVRTFVWKNKKVKKEDAIDEKGKKFKKEVVVKETGWYYYDKTANDGQGDNILVDMPVNFIWLESAQSFTGYSERKKAGIYSNEILVGDDALRKYGRKELIVKCGDEILEKGYYSDIKEAVKGHGGKFCIPVYALMEIDGKWEIVRFLMTGSSSGAWMEFNNRKKNETMMISCYDAKEIEMPTGGSYDAPVFKYVPVAKEILDMASEVCKEVDSYFNYILTTSPAVASAQVTQEEFAEDTDI